MGMKENFTAFWDRVTGKTLYEVSQSIKQLEERLNMQQLDLDASNIKLASCEIDLEAANVEKEVLKIDIEDKKTTIVKQNMTIANLQGEVTKLNNKLQQATDSIACLQGQVTASKGAVSAEELEALATKVAMQEYITEEYKKRMQQIVNLLTVMSQEEKYSDLIKIQTNSIDENGQETRQVYMSFNDMTVQVDEAVTVPATGYAKTAGSASGSHWLNGGVQAVTPEEAATAIKTIVAGNTEEIATVTAKQAEEGIYAAYVENATANVGVMTSIIEESVGEIADEILDLAN